MPLVESVKCTNEMKGQCELRGSGLDYIGQLSVDGGKTWMVPIPSTAQSLPDGKTMIMIPELAGKELLQIKLRDFPDTGGLPVPNLAFSNTARKKLPIQPRKSAKAK